MAYMEELRFACRPGCTDCCRREGYVYLSDSDLLRAAGHLGISAAAFEERFVYRTRWRLRLRKPRGKQCPFLLDDGCQLHPDKPTQCRLFPFWPELVEHPSEWRAAAKHCPGMGTGPVTRIGTALERAQGMRIAYPALYPSQPRVRRRQKSVAGSARPTT